MQSKKAKIIERINGITDENFLEEIFSFIKDREENNSLNEPKVLYNLKTQSSISISEEQRAKLRRADLDIKSGDTFSEKEANKAAQECLAE